MCYNHDQILWEFIVDKTGTHMSFINEVSCLLSHEMSAGFVLAETCNSGQTGDILRMGIQHDNVTVKTCMVIVNQYWSSPINTLLLLIIYIWFIVCYILKLRFIWNKIFLNSRDYLCIRYIWLHLLSYLISS